MEVRRGGPALGRDACSWTHVDKFEVVGQPWGEMPAAGRTLKKVRRGGPALGRESCSWTHVEQFREGDEDNDEDDEN